jgi:hypothetical protein
VRIWFRLIKILDIGMSVPTAHSGPATELLDYRLQSNQQPSRELLIFLSATTWIEEASARPKQRLQVIVRCNEMPPDLQDKLEFLSYIERIANAQ